MTPRAVLTAAPSGELFTGPSCGPVTAAPRGVMTASSRGLVAARLGRLAPRNDGLQAAPPCGLLDGAVEVPASQDPSNPWLQGPGASLPDRQLPSADTASAATTAPASGTRSGCAPVDGCGAPVNGSQSATAAMAAPARACRAPVNGGQRATAATAAAVNPWESSNISVASSLGAVPLVTTYTVTTGQPSSFSTGERRLKRAASVAFSEGVGQQHSTLEQLLLTQGDAYHRKCICEAAAAPSVPADPPACAPPAVAAAAAVACADADVDSGAGCGQAACGELYLRWCMGELSGTPSDVLSGYDASLEDLGDMDDLLFDPDLM